MAFDGITISCIQKELARALEGGRISKIAQPEPDELLITIKNNREQYRLLLSASASLPLVYLTTQNKQGPMQAPNFCMLLRKHIGSGKILSVTQPGLERILVFTVEHRNELGDLCTKKLIAEFMGKHSNLIFCDSEDQILDSIKHVSLHMSSVREVLPGRPYFIPHTQEKLDPLTISREDFFQVLLTKPLPAARAVYTTLTGFSPLMAEELCFRAGLDGGLPTDALDEPARLHLYHTFCLLMEDIKNGDFAPGIFYRGPEPVEYAAFPLKQFSDFSRTPFDSISRLLETYYADKNRITRIRQKSADLRKIVSTALERNGKKLILQEKQMKDTEKKDKYRIYGELLNTYGYSLSPEDKFLDTVNYYTGEPVRVPLDTQLSPAENAKKYFDRYGKLKRTADALQTQIAETKADIAHLESISTALDIARDEEDLSQIREELSDCGYVRRHVQNGARKKKTVFHPLHYISSDGFDMYVGKNNYQNEELTFKFASGGDWWFHAKGMPGSHVIVKSGGAELPDATFEEAGRLAAYYSRGKQAPKVEIDYTLKKNIRKPAGAKPGFVIYHTNYSLMASPDIKDIKETC
ncbi:MAG TPA: NFACT family protein [Candidatus Scatomonas pullistercoris]|uniref:Rqc2 homolog RqcH n=1 Tax=Candidatus Scatomonas pullistercoris TaxID=2840920 RepID=A0A9D1TA09_9FIRM|nr:NFACT family protein [Candidatus Scatomonas pullistercoris]